jgi:hypothetical protein
MVWRPERRCSRWRSIRSRCRPHEGDITLFGGVELRQDRRKTPCKHRLASAGRPDKKQMVSPSCRNLKSTAGQRLITHIRKIVGLIPTIRWLTHLIGHPSILGNGDRMPKRRHPSEHRAI